MSEIEKILKANFIEGAIPATFSDETHLADYNMNLYEMMPEAVVSKYKEGDGNELDSKMKAIHSSSAFAVNLFGYEKIKIRSNDFGIPEGVYDIRYEEQLDTLKHSPKKANLDVYLYNDECDIYIETKLTEPMSLHPCSSTDSYADEQRYDKIEECNRKEFVRIFNILNDGVRHQYENHQMFKHLVGICGNKDKGKKAFLINCHCWNPLIDENVDSDFIKTGERFVTLVEKIASEYNLSLINMNHKEMMEIMEMDEGRRGYVEKRYNLEDLK